VSTTAFFVPRTVEQAIDLKREHGKNILVMGGGTIVMGLVHDGLLFPKLAMSLARAGMSEMRRHDGWLEIGAATPIARVAELKGTATLERAAGMLGGPALRTLATAGGNLFAKSPYGDLCVPLLALDAEVEIASAGVRQSIPLEQFLSRRSIKSDELVVSIHLPKPQGRGAYVKLGRRQANTPSVVSVAVQVVLDANGKCTEPRIALGAAAPHAVRAKQAEAALIGRRLEEASIKAAAQAAQAECNPATDSLASAWYRREMVGVFVRRALDEVGRPA
jgi:xanthine dehydrogenase small subunit